MSNPKSSAARMLKVEGRVAHCNENGEKSTYVYKFKSPSGV